MSSLSELSESIQLGNKVCITPAAYAAIAKLGSAIKGFNRLLYWATDQPVNATNTFTINRIQSPPVNITYDNVLETNEYPLSKNTISLPSTRSLNLNNNSP